MNGGAAKKMKIEPVAEPFRFSTSRIRFGDVMFTDSYLTRRDVSLSQVTTQRIRAGSCIYKVIANNNEIVNSPIKQIGDYEHLDVLFDNTDPFKTMLEKMEKKISHLETDHAQLKTDHAQLRKEFDQSIIDRDSNSAIHELSNYISECRRLIATHADYSSWEQLYDKTKGRKMERHDICASFFHKWGFTDMVDHWKMIEKVSHQLYHFNYYKDIVRGEGQRLLDAIATSTLYKEYHGAFCELVRLVESQLPAEEEVVSSSDS